MTWRKCCVGNWSVPGRMWHGQLVNAGLGLVCVKRVWWLFLYCQMQAELFFIRTILLTSRWCLCNHGWKVILCYASEWWVAFQLSKIRTIKLCASLKDNLLLFSLTSCRNFGKLLAESPNLIYFRIEFFCFHGYLMFGGSCLLGFLSSASKRCDLLVWVQTKNAH